jgi:hypothetical protein
MQVDQDPYFGMGAPPSPDLSVSSSSQHDQDMYYGMGGPPSPDLDINGPHDSIAELGSVFANATLSSDDEAEPPSPIPSSGEEPSEYNSEEHDERPFPFPIAPDVDIGNAEDQDGALADVALFEWVQALRPNERATCKLCDASEALCPN